MARFCGEIGFGDTVEVAPGVWDDVIIEKKFFGDVVQSTLRFKPSEGANDDPDLNTTISIIASAYAVAHIKNMRYLRYGGQLWVLDSIENKYPRIILRLGDVYNGLPTATPNAA
jgi:hypothetical protein